MMSFTRYDSAMLGFGVGVVFMYLLFSFSVEQTCSKTGKAIIWDYTWIKCEVVKIEEK